MSGQRKKAFISKKLAKATTCLQIHDGDLGVLVRRHLTKKCVVLKVISWEGEATVNLPVVTAIEVAHAIMKAAVSFMGTGERQHLLELAETASALRALRDSHDASEQARKEGGEGEKAP